MKPGTRVRMSEDLKTLLRGECGKLGRHIEEPPYSDDGCMACSSEHVEEFGDCIGIVIGLTFYMTNVSGPEVDVIWQPSNLRYAYDPDMLVIQD